MRLIEITGVKCGIEDGTPAHKQGCGVTRALNLLIAAERHAGDAAKMALNGTPAHPADIAFDRRIGGMTARNDPGKRQTGYEILRIVIARNFPGQVRKPEATVRKHR